MSTCANCEINVAEPGDHLCQACFDGMTMACAGGNAHDSCGAPGCVCKCHYDYPGRAFFWQHNANIKATEQRWRDRST